MIMQEKAGLWIEPDSNETRYSTGHYAWQLIEHPNYLEIQDPVLGSFPIGERPEAGLMRDLIMSPLGLRAADIAQLSKKMQHGTIPNIYDFYRLGHVVSNTELVQRLCEKHPSKTTETQRLSWQLAVFLDDLAHGIGSHVTDMIIQGGFGGSENAHQARALEAWEYGRVTEVLKNHGKKVDNRGAIKGISTPPWVEADAPDICAERFQYTVEEMRGWLESADMEKDAREIIDVLVDLDNLVVTEDARLAFKDEHSALLFSKAYLLLSTEHWNEPVHRVIEHLLIEAFKHSVYSRRLPDMSDYDSGETADVASYTYGVDSDLLSAVSTSRHDRDDFMFAISQLLSQLGKEERWRFVEYKREQFIRFLRDPRARDYPSPLLNGHMVDFGPPSSAVEIDVIPGKVSSRRRPAIKANAAELIHTDSGGVQYGLQPMKNRYVDPLVMTDQGSKSLSKINETFKGLLRQHAIIHASKIAVRLAVSGGYEQLIKEVVQSNNVESKIPRRKLSHDQIRWQIEAAAERAKQSAQKAGRLVLNAA